MYMFSLLQYGYLNTAHHGKELPLHYIHPMMNDWQERLRFYLNYCFQTHIQKRRLVVQDCSLKTFSQNYLSN